MLSECRMNIKHSCFHNNIQLHIQVICLFNFYTPVYCVHWVTRIISLCSSLSCLMLVFLCTHAWIVMCIPIHVRERWRMHGSLYSFLSHPLGQTFCCPLDTTGTHGACYSLAIVNFAFSFYGALLVIDVNVILL